MLITLNVYGFWDDEDPTDACHGVMLYCSKLVITHNKYSPSELWQSELYDAHPDEREYTVKSIREELEEALEQFGVPIEDVVNYHSDCIYDWELNYETEV